MGDKETAKNHMSDIIIGTAIVISAFCAKAPQLLKVMENKSSEGLHLSAVTLDLISLTVHSAYLYNQGYPFTDWGDPVTSGFATLLLCLEVFYYEMREADAVTFTLIYGVANGLLMSGVTSLLVITILECIMIPINLMAKLNQAYTNYKECGTGQTSGVTTLMMFCGALIKTLSTYYSTSDSVLVANALVSVIGNGIIGMQILYYNEIRLDSQPDDVHTLM